MCENNRCTNSAAKGILTKREPTNQNRPPPPRPSGSKVPVPSSLAQPRVEDINPSPTSYPKNDASMSNSGVIRNVPQPPTRPAGNQPPPAKIPRTQPIQQETTQSNLF